MSEPRIEVAYGRVPGHELARAEAARFHGVDPAAIVLAHHCSRCGSDQHGRLLVLPTAALREPAHVSLARAGDLSVVAVTDAVPVGVDVEAPGAAEFAGATDVVLHPEEQGDPTRAWVRKEALLKACGLGLQVNPAHVRLDGTTLAAWNSPHPRPEGLWLRDLNIPGFVAAVALLPRVDQPAADITITLRAV